MIDDRDQATPEGERARKCWRTLEAYHGFIYFAPEAAEEYAAIGLHGRSGYFVSRAAAMGRVTPDTVRATFYNFHPDLVARAMADAGDWDPEAVLAARLRAADRVLRRVLVDDIGGDGMSRAAELAGRAARTLGPMAVGRPLAAAHAALPEPGEPHLALWWAISALREFRGDGHLSALVNFAFTGLEALVMHAGSGDVPAAVLRATREWSEDEWRAGVEGLISRGSVRPDGAHTDVGGEEWRRIEAATDRLAAPAWAVLSDDEATELRALVRPWSRALASVIAG